MLKLKGTVFPSVFCATGARGFVGEGYPFHRYWKRLGMDWSGTGFSGKTLTLRPRKGNMPLRNDGMTPQEAMPRCIVTRFFGHGGEMMNAVGLSNFGAAFYLRTGRYHDIREPFFLSLALDASDAGGQETELRDACRLINSYRPFKTQVALQLNFGCPNSGHDLCSFHAVMCRLVEIAKSELGIPVFVNCNALMPTEVLLEAARVADGLWVGNTIPWKAAGTEGRIDWDRFGSVSPVRKRGIDGDGGLSSHQCLQFTLRKVAELRDSNVHIPIVAGNGIRTKEDMRRLKLVGADAIFIGSRAVVRPFGMKEDVAYGTYLFQAF